MSEQNEGRNFNDRPAGVVPGHLYQTPAPSAPRAEALVLLLAQAHSAIGRAIYGEDGLDGSEAEPLMRRLRETMDALALSPSAPADADQWRTAVIDALVVAGIYQQAHDTDPRKAINDLLAWESQVALDPRVSQGARDLLASAPAPEAGEDAMRQRLAGAEGALERAHAIFAWLLGEDGDFPERPERVYGKAYPWYWWRAALRERIAGLYAAPTPSRAREAARARETEEVIGPAHRPARDAATAEAGEREVRDQAARDAIRVCVSRSVSLRFQSNDHHAANEASKCAAAIGATLGLADWPAYREQVTEELCGEATGEAGEREERNTLAALLTSANAKIAGLLNLLAHIRPWMDTNAELLTASIAEPAHRSAVASNLREQARLIDATIAEVAPDTAAPTPSRAGAEPTEAACATCKGKRYVMTETGCEDCHACAPARAPEAATGKARASLSRVLRSRADYARDYGSPDLARFLSECAARAAELERRAPTGEREALNAMIDALAEANGRIAQHGGSFVPLPRVVERALAATPSPARANEGAAGEALREVTEALDAYVAAERREAYISGKDDVSAYHEDEDGPDPRPLRDELLAKIAALHAPAGEREALREAATALFARYDELPGDAPITELHPVINALHRALAATPGARPSAEER